MPTPHKSDKRFAYRIAFAIIVAILATAVVLWLR